MGGKRGSPATAAAALSQRTNLNPRKWPIATDNGQKEEKKGQIENRISGRRRQTQQETVAATMTTKTTKKAEKRKKKTTTAAICRFFLLLLLVDGAQASSLTHCQFVSVSFNDDFVLTPRGIASL